MLRIALSESPMAAKIRECWLFDALYGGVSGWEKWIRASPNGIFYSYHAGGSPTKNSRRLESAMRKGGLTNAFVVPPADRSPSPGLGHFQVPMTFFPRRLREASWLADRALTVTQQEESLYRENEELPEEEETHEPFYEAGERDVDGEEGLEPEAEHLFRSDELFTDTASDPDGELALETDEEEAGYEDDEAFEHDGAAEASALAVLSPSELKAVRITSTFETGRAGSFGGLTGNFDGQGISFGLMNFAWKAGSLLTLLREFLEEHPPAFAAVFGPDAAAFQDIVLATKADPEEPGRRVRDVQRQMEFARSINDANHQLRPPWRNYFGRLETSPEFRRIQVRAVRRGMKRARYWCAYFGLKSERSFAFMFDVVTQQGGAWLNARKFKGKRRKLLQAMLEGKQAQVGRPTLAEIEKLEVIANMIADVSHKDWRERVRTRKLWFVKGKGKVQGSYRDLTADFGVTDAAPVFVEETGGRQALVGAGEMEDFEP